MKNCQQCLINREIIRVNVDLFNSNLRSENNNSKIIFCSRTYIKSISYLLTHISVMKLCIGNSTSTFNIICDTEP